MAPISAVLCALLEGLPDEAPLVDHGGARGGDHARTILTFPKLTSNPSRGFNDAANPCPSSACRHHQSPGAFVIDPGLIEGF